MSRPIGAFFHVPHGLSNAMLLPEVTLFSIAGAASRYAQCARTMQVASQTDSDLIANEKLVEELRALNDELSVPTLAAFGVDKEHYFSVIDVMADQAIASGSPANNPRVPAKQEIVELYKSVWA
jgi:alcohol dehydrogenase class IV